MMNSNAEVDPELLEAIQHNCDLSDARYAGNYTMCIYLLKMREYYRWKFNHGYEVKLSMSEVGNWVQETEQRWDEIEDQDFVSIPVCGVEYEPFNQAAINRGLQDDDLVFSSGLGRSGKPVFFLGDCINRRQFRDYQVFVSGAEYARELAAPPAMTRGKSIFVRNESLKRMLWESIEEWGWHKREGAMARLIDCYNAREDRAALTRLTDDVTDMLVWHEIGECEAGEMLGEAWDAALENLLGDPSELLARAFRDNLADALCVLPYLVSAQDERLIHFYMSMLSPLGKSLNPGIFTAYEIWLEGGGISVFEDYSEMAREHWLQYCRLVITDPDGVLNDASRDPVKLRHFALELYAASH